GVVEAASDELDEDVLEGRLGLAERQDLGAKTAERPDHCAEGAVVDEDEVDGDRLPLAVAVGLVPGGLGGADDARQPAERPDAAIEPVELEPEHSLPLE